MTLTQERITPDEQVFQAAVGTLELFGVYLGRQLGLYDVMRDGKWVSEDEVAQAAGIDRRYAREWLEQQAVAGLLQVESLAVHAEARRYRLEEAVARAVADAEDPTSVGSLSEMVVGIAQALDLVVDAYRTGEGVPYSAYGAAFRHGQGGINRPAFTTDLVETWIPAVDGLGERLSRHGARIADVGCGVGWSTIALAAAYPGAEVIGLDADLASVEEARQHGAARGSNARFETADATAISEYGTFDAVFLLEVLHDLARPVEALAAVQAALRPGGSVIVADEKVAPSFTAPGDDLERMMYGWSISHCLPAARAERPSAAIGTAIRESAVRDLAARAGFSRVEVAPVDAGFFRIYHLRK